MLVWLCGQVDHTAGKLVELTDPILYVIFLWHLDTIDKSDPAIWFDLED
jgi:hypothetical protein